MTRLKIFENFKSQIELFTAVNDLRRENKIYNWNVNNLKQRDQIWKYKNQSVLSQKDEERDIMKHPLLVY